MRSTPHVHLSPMAGVQLFARAELLNGLAGSSTPMNKNDVSLQFTPALKRQRGMEK